MGQSDEVVPDAQRAQMQTLPCASAGMDCSAAVSMVAVMHQHDSGGRPPATAHSFAPPQIGHLVGSLVSMGCLI
ncbi:MAG: hypothetical protein AMJ63_03995 [Myxococcales bacterium SG8_38_1]|jgi:hypothetical protein|nr:MAG: hypothetical protein AMJ63_03995 [Myxococcales bacterium SG8_38_1]